MTRTKSEVALTLFRYRQALKASGIEPKLDALHAVCADIIENKIRSGMEQLIESWPLHDAVAFLREIESNMMPQQEDKAPEAKPKQTRTKKTVQ